MPIRCKAQMKRNRNRMNWERVLALRFLVKEVFVFSKLAAQTVCIFWERFRQNPAVVKTKQNKGTEQVLSRRECYRSRWLPQPACFLFHTACHHARFLLPESKFDEKCLLKDVCILGLRPHFFGIKKRGAGVTGSAYERPNSVEMNGRHRFSARTQMHYGGVCRATPAVPRP